MHVYDSKNQVDNPSVFLCLSRFTYIYNTLVYIVFYESQLAGSLLSANEVSVRGSGGRACQREPFCGYYLQRRVSRLVVFPCYVPGGNSVTFGLDSPLVRLWEGYE